MHKLFLSFLFIATGSTASALDCKPVKFAPGESGAFIDGVLPPKYPSESLEPSCYSVDVRKGQPMFVEVVGGDKNVVVSVIGVGDARRNFEFSAPSNRVEFIVFQLLPSPNEADYSLLVRAD